MDFSVAPGPRCAERPLSRRIPACDFRCLWKATISWLVLAESTFHWLTTVVGVPAIRKAQLIPIMPSPNRYLPRAVSQADSTATSARSLIFKISRADRTLSSMSPLAWVQIQEGREGIVAIQHAVRSHVQNAVIGRVRLPPLLVRLLAHQNFRRSRAIDLSHLA